MRTRSVSFATFDADGVPIRFSDSGAGEAVIFVHGYMHKAKTWKPVRDMLPDRFRAVTFDCRGHGRSGKPHDPASYGLEMVTDVVRLMDHLGIEQSHVVGYSMGAESSSSRATRAGEPAS